MKKEEQMKEIEESVVRIMKAIGENSDREGVLDTPARVGRMYLNEIFSGYSKTEKDVEDILMRQFDIDDEDYDIKYDGMIIVKDIDFVSYCEHHMVPFIGKAHIAYIPSDKVVGLSKLARVVDVYAKRMQVQERLTEQIINAIQKYLKPKGIMVIMEAQHYCMVIRGVKKENAVTVTSSIRGVFEKNEVRNEALTLIEMKR